MDQKADPIKVVPMDIEQAKATALLVATYYWQLVRANVPNGLAAALTRDWQNAHLQNRGVITAKND